MSEEWHKQVKNKNDTKKNDAQALSTICENHGSEIGD